MFILYYGISTQDTHIPSTFYLNCKLLECLLFCMLFVMKSFTKENNQGLVVQTSPMSSPLMFSNPGSFFIAADGCSVF